MTAYLARDFNGTLKCFYKNRPIRHEIIGTWESRPMSAREYFTIPSNEQSSAMMKLTWMDEPLMVEMSMKPLRR